MPCSREDWISPATSELYPKRDLVPALELLLSRVMFYEVLAPGYHSPLTKTQIAELFQAGRLDRHTPLQTGKGGRMANH